MLSTAVAAAIVGFIHPGTASAAPCTSATAACVQWIALGGGPHRSLVYSTYALDVRNDQITRALVLVHGAGRDADNMFRTGVAAALIAGALDNTVVISVRFASRQGACRDTLAADEVNWDCGEGSSGGWRAGAASVVSDQLTSFDLTDAILRTLSRQETFPSLRRIVLAGFSAGGQHVNRYAMVNRIHDELRVPVHYVVGSPSSYGYPDSLRPARNGNGVEEFPDARNCTTYNRWPFGLEERTGYSARLTDDEIRRQLATRPTAYVIGELETPQAPALDVSCPAMAQGASRMARGEAFFKYLANKYRAQHTLTVVPQCGHNGRCVFTAGVALPILFPQQESP